LNHTAWSYLQPREYVIGVRAYDSNSYSEQFLTIVVKNVRPVSSLTAQSSQPSNYVFDASQSWDTSSDNASLEFRYNFGDGNGWSEWSSSKKAWNYYTADDRYTALLEVRDQWGMVGSTSITILIDNGPPTIQLVDSSFLTQAYVGDEVVVLANITDVSDIAKVLLVYQIENKTYSIVMSRIAGSDIYAATIPALNATGPLDFHVEAEDVGGHSALSTTISAAVLERPDDTWMYILIVALATIVVILLLYLRALKMVVDEVFFIYEDGNLIAHQTRRLKPGMDDQILGSMLVAIQNFVRDSFKDEGSTGLNRMDFGEKKVLVEKGDHIYLAVVLHGKREGKVPQRMRDTIAQAEEDFHDALNGWDGDLDKVRGIKDRAGPLLKGSIKDILPVDKEDAEQPDQDVPAGETIECPVCDTPLPLDSTSCPKCGADLAMAGMDELATVADDIKKDDR
jgi:hypothetical protein